MLSRTDSTVHYSVYFPCQPICDKVATIVRYHADAPPVFLARDSRGVRDKTHAGLVGHPSAQQSHCPGFKDLTKLLCLQQSGKVEE